MKTYKAQIIIKTEEFCNISPAVEGTPEEIVEAYREFRSAINTLKPQVGLSDKEFNDWLDNYLVNGTGDAGKYAEMSPEQMNVIQQIKKSTKRIKSRNGDNE